MLAVAHRPVRFADGLGARADRKLPGVGLGEPEDVRDLPVGVDERLAEHEDGSFGGGELLTSVRTALLERFAPRDSVRGIGGGVGRLREATRSRWPRGVRMRSRRR